MLADLRYPFSHGCCGCCWIWTPLFRQVESGLDGGEAWTPRQYSVIVQTILSSPHQAVPVSFAKASIGKAALDALVQANLLSYRPQSSESPTLCS